MKIFKCNIVLINFKGIKNNFSEVSVILKIFYKFIIQISFYIFKACLVLIEQLVRYLEIILCICTMNRKTAGQIYFVPAENFIK